FSPAPSTTTSNPGSAGEEGGRMDAILAARARRAAETPAPPRPGVTGPTPGAGDGPAPVAQAVLSHTAASSGSVPGMSGAEATSTSAPASGPCGRSTAASGVVDRK